MTIYSNSRYKNTKVFKIDNKYSIGIRDLLKSEDYGDNITHIISSGERVDSIAYKYWGRSDLYWVICDWNDIFDPLDDIIPGKVLTLPSYQRILEAGL